MNLTVNSQPYCLWCEVFFFSLRNIRWLWLWVINMDRGWQSVYMIPWVLIMPPTLSTVLTGGEQNCKWSIASLCLSPLCHHNVPFDNITQRLSRLLSISFRIRASRAALMAESRMLFSATRSTTFSGLSSYRSRKGMGDLRPKQSKINQRSRNISWRNVH